MIVVASIELLTLSLCAQQELHHLLRELHKKYALAKDNVKFLTTLERHFKILHSGSLNAMAETITPMMGAIRMVRACVAFVLCCA